MLWIAFGVAALVLFGIGRVLFWSPIARTRRALSGVQPSSVHQIVGGVVRVTGMARRRGELLRAPMSGRLCMAYQLRVDIQERVGEGHSWRDVLVLKQARDFLVEDGTGTVLVEPDDRFELLLVEDDEGGGWRREWPSGEWDRVVSMLEQANVRIDDRSRDPEPRLRYHEGVLEEGETVSVLGHATREVRPDGERPSPRSPPELLVMRGSSGEPVRISDDPSIDRPLWAWKEHARRITDAIPPRPVQLIAGAAGRVTGVARPCGGLLQAPITQRHCLAYQLRIEERISDGEWREVLVLRDACDLEVDYVQGAMLVRPGANFEITLGADTVGHSVSLKHQDQTRYRHLVQVLTEANIALTTPLLEHECEFRFQEARLEPNEMVSVEGVLGHDGSADGEHSDALVPAGRLAMRGSSDEPVRISDAPANRQ